ncbi:MAG: hypothetical protein KBF17_16030 [Candidatus Promineofilum sp.]|nr:hypothetical protein [Promineifilum sp.]MBP9656719.1 hypothetical protein [Promineifilum sp.]
MNEYYGQPTGRIENDALILDYLLEAGPRLVRLIPRVSGDNLLAETPDFTLESPHRTLRLWGGHRLWHAPESAARTYIPDSTGVRTTTCHLGVTLSYDEPYTGIGKELEVIVHPTEARVQLNHRLTNQGLWPVELAPWAITQLRPGGTAVLPVSGPQKDDEGLLPDRLIALWPYSHWDDSRFRPNGDTIEIDALPVGRPFKIGTMNRAGWMAYRYNDLTFTKRWHPQPAQPHADFGCNAEIYTNDSHLELETLGPLSRLEPGGTVEHVEEWEIQVAS